MHMGKGSIIIVDDNKNVLNTLRILLAKYFEEIYLLSSPNALISTIRDKNPDIALLDMNYSAGINSGNEGLYWLSEVKKIEPETPVVLFTAYADIELAVKALKYGATDFIVKPWNNTKLIATLQSAYALSQSRKELKKLKEKQNVLNEELFKEEDICWGQSEMMQNLLSMIKKVAPTDANILITGENGTGKELIAKTIHKLSSRRSETMVTVDMGSITESLFESELFGHVKGAFTDAKTDRAGKFEAADKGSLFLDEIGNLDFVLQSKLLTALQARRIVRVGSNKAIDIDTRLICATNADLNQSVDEGSFREDLLYRINTIHLEVPPLRQRKEDISLLANFFLQKLKIKYSKPNLFISEDAIKMLEEYHWPGNVRELQHTIEKAVILGNEQMIKPSDLYLRSVEPKEVVMSSMTIEEMERVLIEKAMKKYDNNISAVAQELGVTRPTLYNKLKKYGI